MNKDKIDQFLSKIFDSIYEEVDSGEISIRDKIALINLFSKIKEVEITDNESAIDVGVMEKEKERLERIHEEKKHKRRD